MAALVIAMLLFTLVFFVVIMMVSVNVFAVVLALLMTRQLKSAGSLRATLFAPYILNVVTIGFLWQFIFGRFFTSLYKETDFFLGTTLLDNLRYPLEVFHYLDKAFNQ